MSKNDSNDYSAGTPMTPAAPKDNTGKIVLIIFIIFFIMIVALPITIFAIIYFMIIRPLVATGIDHIMSYPSGKEIESVYSRSIENIYNAYGGDATTSRLNCVYLDDFIDDASDDNLNVCFDAYMMASFDEAEDGHLKMSVLTQDEERVEIETNHSFTKYYSLKIYNVAGDASDYKKIHFVGEESLNPSNDNDDTTEDNDIDSDINNIIY